MLCFNAAHAQSTMQQEAAARAFYNSVAGNWQIASGPTGRPCVYTINAQGYVNWNRRDDGSDLFLKKGTYTGKLVPLPDNTGYYFDFGFDKRSDKLGVQKVVFEAGDRMKITYYKTREALFAPQTTPHSGTIGMRMR